MKFVIFISGPTGVGKTELVLKLAQHVPLEIINADVGQLYTPFTIGTAKPAWRTEQTPHHLFDVLDSPVSLSVHTYRQLVLPLVQSCWQQNTIPVFVGGSLFYIKALLYPPQEQELLNREDQIPTEHKDLWQQLYEIDKERALAIHPHDYYRLRRALTIWYATGVKPSLCKPTYQPFSPYLFLYMTRNRDDLYKRINERVMLMLQSGWIEETKKIVGTPWEDFLEKKKLIGYDDIISYLRKSDHNLATLQEKIAQKTRHYAKRQEIFWRGFRKHLEHDIQQSPLFSKIETANLTLLDPDIYSNQLLLFINNLSRESVIP